jgi:diguanylate cyclase (GGDEF)-like protein/PAS domain S-box-containing protein
LDLEEDTMEMRHDFAKIVENMHDGLYFVDRMRRITYWNKAAERITGFQAAEVMGHCCAENILIHVDSEGHELCKGICPLAATIEDGSPREAYIFLHHKQGHRIPVSVCVTALEDEQGKIIGGIELFSDTSSQEALHLKVAQLEKLALIDPLTQLPNRRYLNSELDSQFAKLSRSGVPFGVLFVDIDYFKRFNDEHGHAIGDLALQTVAQTLTASVRPFDTIGRWGGEEFVGVFPNSDVHHLKQIADRLCVLVRHSRVETEKGPIKVTISIGGSIVTEADTTDSLLKRADTLMYVSKQSGRDRATIDSP